MLGAVRGAAPSRRSLRAALVVAFLGACAADCTVAGRGTPALALGDATYVCVVLASSLDWETGTTYMRIPFKLELDAFSKLEVARAWTPYGGAVAGAQEMLGAADVSLSLQTESQRSYQRRWRATHDGVASTFPVLFAEVGVEDGKVTGVSWDSGCYDCDADSRDCVKNEYNYDGSAYKHASKQCVVSDDTCAKSGGAKVSELCKLTIYVSWTGTDKDGRALLSQQRRFSRMERDQVATFVADLSKESAAL